MNAQIKHIDLFNGKKSIDWNKFYSGTWLNQLKIFECEKFAIKI